MIFFKIAQKFQLRKSKSASLVNYAAYLVNYGMAPFVSLNIVALLFYTVSFDKSI